MAPAWSFQAVPLGLSQALKWEAVQGGAACGRWPVMGGAAKTKTQRRYLGGHL